MTRAALIRGGMEHTLLRDLRRMRIGRTRTPGCWRPHSAAPLSRGDVMALLGLSKQRPMGACTG